MKQKTLFSGLIGAAVLSVALILIQTTDAGYIQGTRVKTEHPSPFSITISPDGNTLFVVNQSGHSVTFIDAKARKVIGEVAVHIQPESAVCTPDGKTLYVCNAESDSVSVIDIASRKETKEIKVGDWPCGITCNKDGSKVYVTCSGNLWNKVDIIDTSRNEKVGEIEVGYGPRGLALSPDGKMAAVINDTVGSINRTVGFIDLAANKMVDVRTLRHSANLRSIAYSPDGQFVVVTFMKPKNWLPVCEAENGEVFTNNIAVIETRPGGKVAQLPLDELNNYDGTPYGLQIGPEGKYLYIAVRGMHRVTILDFEKIREIVSSNTQEQLDTLTHDLDFVNHYLVQRVPTGLGPSWLVLSPDGKYCYTSNYFSNNVSVIRTPL
ncbi:MAG: YncE family protein [Candidatus Brocadiales bacterium]